MRARPPAGRFMCELFAGELIVLSHSDHVQILCRTSIISWRQPVHTVLFQLITRTGWLSLRGCGGLYMFYDDQICQISCKVSKLETGTYTRQFKMLFTRLSPLGSQCCHPVSRSCSNLSECHWTVILQKKIDSDRNLFVGIIAHYVAEIEQIMNKGKVAVDDVTLWANCCTKCHGNTISRFHLIAYYVTWVNYSHGITYVLWHPAHSDIIFDPRAITVRGAFVHKIWRV